MDMKTHALSSIERRKEAAAPFPAPLSSLRSIRLRFARTVFLDDPGALPVGSAVKTGKSWAEFLPLDLRPADPMEALTCA